VEHVDPAVFLEAHRLRHGTLRSFAAFLPAGHR